MSNFVIERDKNDKKIRREMTAAEVAARDAPLSQAVIDAEAEQQTARGFDKPGISKALAVTLLSEINILREAAGLQPRTPAQLRAAIKKNM